MDTQKGFAGLSVLIALVLGLVVVGGGAYLVVHKSTIKEVTPLPYATFDQSSLSQEEPARTAGPVITGTASGVDSVQICTEGLCLGYVSVIEGHWSKDLANNKMSFLKGTYPLALSDSKGRELATGTLVISKASEATLSVPGMSKYTDSAFGFSFWYPSEWTVSTESNSGVNTYPNGSYEGVISIRSNANPSLLLTIQKVTANDFTYRVSPGACGYCGPVNYFFDTSLHTWMKVYPSGPNGAPDATPEQVADAKIPKPADVSHNTMGGLHIFSSEQKGNESIVPLSAKNFVVVGEYSGQNPGSGIELPIIQTIVASDPSVAVPVSLAKQKATIEAEQKAYAGQ